MENFRQELATRFEQYQLLTTDAQRQMFWSEIERFGSELSADQRMAYQKAVRDNIEFILERMQSIERRLTLTKV